MLQKTGEEVKVKYFWLKGHSDLFADRFGKRFYKQSYWHLCVLLENLFEVREIELADGWIIIVFYQGEDQSFVNKRS